MSFASPHTWAPALGLIALTSLGCPGDFPSATIDVGDKSVRVEVAATPDLRARGLMNRDSLGADRGMLFVYPDERTRSFWMKNVKVPLDIAFADSTGKIVRITDMKAFDTGGTASLYPATYALEMNKGWFASNSVEVGDTLGRLPSAEAK